MSKPDAPPPPHETAPVLPAVAQEFLPDALAIETQPVPWMGRALLYVLLGLIVSAITWATLAEMDRIVVARGRLLTTASTMVVQPMDTSVVRSLDARVGQVVRKGEVLGTFDPTFTEADVGQLRTRMESLNAQITRIRAEMAGGIPTSITEEHFQEQLFRQRHEHYVAKMAQFEASIARLRATMTSNNQERKSLAKRAENIKEIESMYAELLSKNSGSRLKLLETHDLALTIQKDWQAAESRTEELNRSITAIETERETFVREWRLKLAEELVTAQRELNGVMEQLSKAERKRELVNLTAPADAVVLEVAKRSVGSVVKEAEPLYTLVPLDSPLEAEVEVESGDIGLLREGDYARLKLDAFPYQKHGTLSAKVRTISRDAFIRQPQVAALKGGEAYFLARLDLGEVKLLAVPENTRLVPGMTVTAEIVIGSRTVISYFLYPLIRTLDEGLREP